VRVAPTPDRPPRSAQGREVFSFPRLRGKVGMGADPATRLADIRPCRHMPETLILARLSEVCRLGPALRLKFGTPHHKDANYEHSEQT
jgi:hypothetical protein